VRKSSEPAVTMSRSDAFGFLCTLLSLNESLEQTDQLRRAAQSGSIPWDAVVDHASRQWVSAAVSYTLHRKGLKNVLPKDLEDYFEGMATLNRQRNERLRAEAIDMARILNSVGITPVFLKGAANLFGGLYPDPAQRIMLDLDALISTEQLTIAVRAMQAHGYNELVDTAFPAHHHYPPLGRAGGTASIELHTTPLDFLAPPLLSSAEIVEHATELSIEGVRFAVPSACCRLVHCIVHTHFSDHAYIYGDLSLRELLDTALLSRAETIDWRLISKRFNTRRGKMALAFHLLAARLLGAQSSDVDTSTSLGYVLFRRAQIQTAFPGIATSTKILLRPWLLLLRALSHPLLRRRLLSCLFDPTWYARQWRMLWSGAS
jgi:hypothetical protein